MSRGARGGFVHAIIATVIVVIAVAVAVAVMYVRSSLPKDQGTVSLPGLEAPVTIGLDSLAVPYVRARSLEDAYFAEGYLHARDRLWQMEVTRRVAQGRLAQVLGEKALDTDRFLRTIGLWRAAGAMDSALVGQPRRLVEAYVAGVNAWLAHRHGALPPEFLVLGFKPQHWTVRDVMGVEKVMALELSNYEMDAGATRAAVLLGDSIARKLLPAYPGWGATILGDARPMAVPTMAANLLNAFSISQASNSWAISGQHTVSGKPILANDPHLLLQAPSVWYLIDLHADSLDVVGASLPGSPFVVLGHNRAVAWGMTNAMVDGMDLFVERRDPADSSRYLTPHGSLPFQRIEEQIPVKGRRQPVPLRILLTRHGPVVSNAVKGLGDRLIAMRWTSQNPSHTVQAIAKLDRARDWQDFVQAVRLMDDPDQNVVYADTAGNIGYYMGGTVPLRNGHKPPVLPVPGWTGEWDWTGVLPFDQHPHVLNPTDGFVVTANNKQAADGVADLISQHWEEPFRAMRILQMLHQGGPFDAADVAAQQMDVLDVKAQRFSDRAVAAAEADSLSDVAELLKGWNFKATATSHAATVFYLWLDELQTEMRHRLYGSKLAELRADLPRLSYGPPQTAGFMPRDVVTEAIDNRALPWLSGPAAARAYHELADSAMEVAVERARGRAWGQVQEVLETHVLGGVKLLNFILHLDVGPKPRGGSPTTVNVALSQHSNTRSGLPLLTTEGPSLRFVVDLADLDHAGGFIIGTGESGIPFSPHYRDQFEWWLEGKLWPVPVDTAAADARILHRMTLEPQTRDGS